MRVGPLSTRNAGAHKDGGLAQIFSRHFGFLFRLAALAALVIVTALILLWRAVMAYPAGVHDALEQPIPFSHKHHVGDDGIDCRFCHTTVETEAHAGLPSTGVCLGCHSQLFRDQAVLAPLRDSAARGRPVPWRRVHVLPDFVFFNHGVHVAKGVACVECHGRVDQMPIEWRAQPLRMQWCLDCHRDPAPRLRPPSQVFAMDAPRVAPAQAGLLAQAAHLESRRRMTDCSTCHR